MDDPDSFFAVQFPSNFPMDDMIQIASDLMADGGWRMADGGIVAGYTPTELGTLDLMVMKYSEFMGKTTVILPNRPPPASKEPGIRLLTLS
ncbi:hypothetical protein JK169_11500 [Acetobacter persici]|uniref:hypothetical protein n=1 Tax=Acetobacter persici TaxID=1076596 RepID=UPI001BA8E57D|nr:hypothetical protein [Acetobacter persici]MBS1001623.1 hypothetical protein [Acetobacter persici]